MPDIIKHCGTCEKYSPIWGLMRCSQLCVMSGFRDWKCAIVLKVTPRRIKLLNIIIRKDK